MSRLVRYAPLAILAQATLLGCHVYAEPAVATPEAEVVVSEPPQPPPAPVEPVPPQPVGAVWIPGHYRWMHHHGYVWVRGHYEYPPQPNAVFVPGHWELHGGGRIWIEGHWS